MSAISPDDAVCSLCHRTGCGPVAVTDRHFYHCLHCDAVFVASCEHVDEIGQRKRYAQHDNCLDNANYVAMLQQPIDSLKANGLHSGRVLDYGSGPAPVGVELLRRASFDAVGYDPLYAPDADLSESFDAVVSIETFEHFVDPAREMERIRGLLRPNGLLAVMTLLHEGPDSIATWWYARDVTHVVFYSEKTLNWIADAFGFELLSCDGVRLATLRRL